MSFTIEYGFNNYTVEYENSGVRVEVVLRTGQQDIDAHNADTNAHPDIRQLIADIEQLPGFNEGHSIAAFFRVDDTWGDPETVPVTLRQGEAAYYFTGVGLDVATPWEYCGLYTGNSPDGVTAVTPTLTEHQPLVNNFYVARAMYDLTEAGDLVSPYATDTETLRIAFVTQTKGSNDPEFVLLAEQGDTGGGGYSPPIPQSDVTGLVADLAAKALKGTANFVIGAPFTATQPGVISSFHPPVTLPDASLWENEEITILAVGFGAPGDDVVISAHAGQTINLVSPTFTLEYNEVGFPNLATFRAVQAPVLFGGGWTWAMVNHAGPQFVKTELEEVDVRLDDLEAVVDDIPTKQTDKRPLGNELLRQEWNAITHPILATNQNIADAGTYNGTWDITRATTRGTLPHTPAGVDIQCFHMIQRPYTQAELDAEGILLTESFQTFYEMMTLVRPSIRNDWFEFARVFLDATFTGQATTGSWGYFWEGTIIGGAAEGAWNATRDSRNTFGWPERARLTVNCSASTLTFWEWIPLDTGEAGVEQCQLGRWWRPWFVDVNAQWASMANPETETVPAVHEPGFNEGDPEVMEPWRIGIQARMQFAEFYFFEYGETDPANALLAIDEAALTAAGVGSSSFVDSTGLNTIASVNEALLPGPAKPVYNPLVIKTPKFYTLSDRDWDIPGTHSTTMGSTTPSTNRPFFQPFTVKEDSEYDAVMHEITAAGASGTVCRFAIYAVDEFFQLTDLVYQTPTFPGDPGAVPAVQIVTASIILPRGGYMGVSINNGSVQFRTIIAGLAEMPTPITPGVSGFRSFSTLVSRTYAVDGFPADATTVPFTWDRDISQTTATNPYIFRLREV